MMKRLFCALLAASLLGSGGAALAHEDDVQPVDPIIQIVSEYQDADDQIDALLELRTRVNEMIEMIGSQDFEPLERNDISDAVTKLQERLAELGYLDRINGKYDNETVKAIKQFEKTNGLENDGKASVLDQLILFSDSALNSDGELLPSAPASPDADPAPDAGKPGPDADKPAPDADKPAPDKPAPDADEPDAGGSDMDGYAPFDLAAYTADPDAYQDSKVLLSGSVAQILTAQGDTGALIIADADGQRIYVEAAVTALEDVKGGDTLNVYAYISGQYEYNTLSGQARSLPRAVADAIEVIG